MNVAVIYGGGDIVIGYDRREDTGRSLLTGCRKNGYEKYIIVDPYRKNAKLIAEVPGAVLVDELPLDLSGIDVFIATPDALHYEHALEVIKRNPRAVMIEKPLALRLEQAEDILSYARQVNSYIQVNYFRRYLPDFIRMRERIQSGEFGRIQLVTGLYGKGLFHNGSHLINLLINLSDQLVLDTVYYRHDDYQLEDPSVAFGGYFSLLGVVAPVRVDILNSNYFTQFECKLFFEAGAVTIADFGQSIIVERAMPLAKLDGYMGLQVVEEIKTDFYNSAVYSVGTFRRQEDTNGLVQAVETIRYCENLRKLL